MRHASEAFSYDAFLSYSSQDKDVVRDLAERLRKAGLRVWFDEWEIGPGDAIPAKIEGGLEHSRVLVLCMSEHTPDSDWAQFEASTFRFRDPLNRERRFLLLRLDDAEIRSSLRQFEPIDMKRGIDFAVSEIVRHLSELALNDWRRRWEPSLRGPGRSESVIVRCVLNACDDLLKEVRLPGGIVHSGIVSLISDTLQKHRDYELLRRLKNDIDAEFTQRLASVEGLPQAIQAFRNAMDSIGRKLAVNGARVIESGDRILLYAYSESVHHSIETWLLEHPTDSIQLIFCQCLWKLEGQRDLFREAKLWADRISHPNARLVFTTDTGAGGLLKRRQVDKVLFGAYQWHWRSGRRAWFTNTPGTLAIAAVADKFDVPIFVLTETKKSHDIEPGEPGVTKRPPSRHDAPPRQTKYGMPIGYEDSGADEIDSSEIPFVLITEDGEFSCADFDLRKRNRVTLDGDMLSVTKRTIDGASARSEGVVLRVLGRRSPTPKYQAPLIMTGPTRWARVRMQRKTGVRLHDFVATLNELTRRGMSEMLSRRAAEFREVIRVWALQDVQVWQSDDIQQPLREAFGSEVRRYEFARRFTEAVNYVWSCSGSRDSLAQDVVRDVEEFGDRLEGQAKVLLRDASLKNQILELGGLCDLSQLQTEGRDFAYPGADEQWFDPQVAQLILVQIPDRIPYEQVRDNIWHVDFELACSLSTPADDFTHVLALEIFKLSYDEIIQQIAQYVPKEDPQQFHETVLFRCFRGWARRLSYARERPDIYATRYRHESLGHYHQLALSAVQSLQGELGSSLSRFIQESARLATR